MLATLVDAPFHRPGWVYEEKYDGIQRLVRRTPAFVDPPRQKTAVWLAPTLVAQIAFQEWTADWKLRQPVYLGLRDDKTPRECRLPAEA